MHTIEIPMPDGGVAEAYVARPSAASGSEHPGVLFYMDAIGLRPRIAEMAQRIADWGYVVLAPNVFYRDGSADDLAPKADLTAARRARGVLQGRDAAGPGAHRRQGRGDIPAYLAGAARTPGCRVRSGRDHRLLHGRPARGPHGQPSIPRWPRSAGSTAVAWSPTTTTARTAACPNARAEFVFGHADNDRSMPPEAIVDPGGGAARRGAHRQQRGVRRGGARLLDVRHLDVRRGGHRAAASPSSRTCSTAPCAPRWSTRAQRPMPPGLIGRPWARVR